MIYKEVASEGFKLVFKEIISLLGNKTSKFKTLKSINVDNAYLKASKVEQVKTIWQVDKNVNLNEFYYPSRLIADSKRVNINYLKDLPENGKIVIQGTAGQGKSILLRYLTGAELKHGNSIPIFVELRKISDRQDVETLIINSLSNLGIECDATTLSYIYESNKCSFIFDAFDEVTETEVKTTLTYIENLCSKYHGMRIIISSRPDSSIQRVTYFDVLNLCPLKPTDFLPMLQKLFSNDQTTKAEEIVEAINTNKSGIAQLITTPLLLTLLSITYKSYHRIPEKLHEFYDNLFSLLVNRHDKSKPGFARKFKTGLNENQLEELFCAFCFFCMKNRKNTLTKKEAISLIKQAKSIIGPDNVDEIAFIDDIKNITCLILEEGFQYHFIHKSIKDYHAANFIANSHIELKEKFYRSAIRGMGEFRQEIMYLRHIDNYYCDTLFTLPIYERLFQLAEFREGKMNLDETFFESCTASIIDGKFTTYAWHHPLLLHCNYFNIHHILYEIIRRTQVKDKYIGTNTSSLNFLEIFDKDAIDNILISLQRFLEEKYLEYQEINSRITAQQKAISKIEF